MRPVNAPVRKTVIAVTAVAALSGAGLAAPAIVSAATDDRPTGRTVVDVADDHVRQEQGHHHREPGDDRAVNHRSGFDSPHDRAERTSPNGRHFEPGDDRSNDANETDDSGFDSPHDRAERTTPDGRHLEPGDDHGNHVEPGDDDGSHVEPGDDHGGSNDSGSDDSGHGGSDDSGHGGSDDSGHGGGDD